MDNFYCCTKMRYRDNLKMQYDMTQNDVRWKLYKNARNDVSTSLSRLLKN